jgi:cobalt-zinc-cadmium efflux system outer membrane protein
MDARRKPTQGALRPAVVAWSGIFVCSWLVGCSKPVLNYPKATETFKQDSWTDLVTDWAKSPPQPGIQPGQQDAPGGQFGQQRSLVPPLAPSLPNPIAAGAGVRPASAYTRQQDALPGREDLPAPPGVQDLSQRLKIPSQLPGADAPPLRIPPREAVSPQQRNELIDELFPNRPPVPKLAPPAAGPTTLKQVEDLALANNPELVQASAQVTTAMGAAIQAGVHPNPVLGYESDTVGSFGTRNYQGVFGSQLIKTANKLGLARAVANFDLMNAQLALRRTRIDVLSRIKAAYFAVLVARQNVAVSGALVWFTNEAYRIQVDRLREGESTGYEPAQLRSLANQARGALVQAQNRYISAWKQLAAIAGLPELPTAELEGRADMLLPPVNYDKMLSRVLNNHPDVLAARNLEAQSRLQLQLQRVTPVPDVQLYGTLQRDFTVPSLPRTTYNMQVGVPLPLFDRNRGNIMSAEGNLRRAAEQIRRVRNELTFRSADAFERFETNRVLLQYYQDQILPDLARAYRGVYERHQQEPEAVGFGDIIVAQQNLAAAVAVYIATLNAQWLALADIANLMQIEDFNEISSEIYAEEVPGVMLPDHSPLAPADGAKNP